MTTPEPVARLLLDDGGELSFDAPWQAQVFAITLQLHERGVFTWPEWTEVLGKEIAQGSHGNREDGYYSAWLAAVEVMIRKKGLVNELEISKRRSAWEAAARSTPHGLAIELDR